MSKSLIVSETTPLHIYKTSSHVTLRPSKETLKEAIQNPNSKEAQNYSNVKDPTQEPYAMSTLEILHIFLVQHKALLTVIDTFNSFDSNLMKFMLATISLIFLIMPLYRSK